MADVPSPSGRQSFFEVYKRGQGYYTRVGTAAGAGVLTAGLFHFIWNSLTFDETWAPGMWLKIGIPLAVVIVLGLFLYWVIGVNRKSCDFMIATDGEMKKVNWTTKREVIAATKVVILVTLLTAGILYVVDWLFMTFFLQIGVLRHGGG
jgi:preprotein translocase SecE subunit